MGPALATVAGLLILLPLAARKWELKRRHYLPWTVLVSLASGGFAYGLTRAVPGAPSAAVVSLSLAIAGASSLGAILFCFFRDPERRPPGDRSLIVSPADGTVVYVKEIEAGQFPFAVKNNREIPLEEFSHQNLVPDRGIQIGIAMNYLNVHVNRSPVAGVVTLLKPIPGKFLSLKHLHALLENERTLLVIENDELRVGMVQIASRLVRRIVPYVSEGQSVQQGQRVGMIRFGSQVDVLVPYRPDLKVQVNVGSELIAGESVLITCGPVAPVATSAAVTDAGTGDVPEFAPI